MTKLRLNCIIALLQYKFTVRTERFDGANASGASLSLESRVNALLQDWTARGGETDGVLFVGDSFFDTRSYWTDFYTTYGRKNAFSVGISATTTTDWEILSERLVYPLAPAAVVVHCGTNNIFDDGKTGAEAAEDIIRLFGLIGHNLPDAEIYYFGIEPRVGRPTADVIACNAAVAEYCGWEDNLTYLDSPAFCSDPDGNAVADFFKDGVHPKPENYIYYVDALDEAGLTFAPSAAASVTEIAAFTTALSDTIASSREIIYRAMPLREEYVLTGKVDITDIAANAHMQFRFDGNDNRFLLWDANIAGATSDNRFGLGWKCGSAAYVTEEARYTFTPGETLTIGFRLIVSEHNAYFYFYDTAQSAYVMEAVFMNVPVAENLLVGTEFMAARVYDLSALTKLDDPVAYAAALASAGIDAYESAAAPGTVLYAGSAPDGSYVLRADEPLPEPIEVTDNFTLFGKNESQSAFTGTERDYVLVQDGESGISGDFAFTYDVTILDSDMTEQTSVSQNSHNWFYVVTASPVSGRGIWNDGYHLLYWKKNAADAAIVSYRTGETLRQGMTALSFTAVTVRSGDTLTLAMVFDDGTRVEKTVDVSGVGALTLWLGGSDANFRITDAVFSRDAADIAAALGQSV